MDLPDRSDDGEDAEVVWLYDPADDAVPVVCGPTELLELLADLTRRAGLSEVTLRGTVSGVRRRHWGVTFDLVDQTPGASAPDAIVRCVVFASAMTSIDHALERSGVELRDGMEVEATGELRWEIAWGSVRLVIADLELLAASGRVQQARDRLLHDLSTSGLLTAQAGRRVPSRPLRIGVLTGAGTAGEADVAAGLEEAGVEWQLVRRCAPMSGAAAAGGVAAGVRALDSDGVDVIVIARGGGARGELAWADSEEVCRAVATCNTPVWAAVGHATDQTLLDAVANRSCPTPSAAAAALVEQVRLWERRRHEKAVLTDHAERVAAIRDSARTAKVVAVLAVVALLVVLGVVL